MRAGLAGKVALVTGAASGIGAATAAALGAEGATVLLTDIDDEAGTETAAALTAAGCAAEYHHLDVAQGASWQMLAAIVSASLHTLHVLVNNAGIVGDGDIETITEETWNRVIGVTQTGTWLGMKHAGPLIAASGGGSIVNISSIYGTSGGNGRTPAYHAAKGAVRTLTKNAALHWARAGVRVNSVHPGFIETPLMARAKANPATEERVLTLTPMARWGRPEEVAAAVVFLAGDQASFVTGSELYVDGGYTAQ